MYYFLATVAQQDNEYIVWYSPDIKRRVPDFVPYNNKVGLVIFEVKDWSLEQILDADKKQFLLLMNGSEETRKNPMKQPKEYFFACMDALKKDGRLQSTAHGQARNPREPVSYGVIFSNSYSRPRFHC